MRKILKSKKGITLVELIIGMVVLAIILAMASAILFPMMRFQARANELAEQNALLDDLANQIIHDLSMATGKVMLRPPAGNINTNPTFPITLTAANANTLIIPIHAGAGGNVEYNITNETTPDFEANIIIRQQADVPNPLLPGEFHMRMNRAGLRVDSITLDMDEEKYEDTGELIYTLTLRLGRPGNDPLTFTRNYAVRPLALIPN